MLKAPNYSPVDRNKPYWAQLSDYESYLIFQAILWLASEQRIVLNELVKFKKSVNYFNFCQITLKTK